MIDYSKEIIRRREELLCTIDITSSSREDRAKQIEKRILTLIEGLTVAGGVSQGEIAKSVRINRKNIIKYLNNLSTRGLIRRGKGRHGRYLATKCAPFNSRLSAEIFAQLFVGRVLINEDAIGIAEVLGPYIKPKLPYEDLNYELERVIFDFSNTIGAFVTYTLIQAMNSNNAIDGNTRDAVEKDLMIQKWVSDIISELQQYLLPFFKDCIQYCLPTLYDRCNKNGEYETLVYYKLHEPKYLSDNSMTNDLTNSFSRVYPDLWTTFEKIKKIWPKALQREKDEMELLSTKYLTQKKCRHTYKNFTRDELGSLSVRSVRHCVKCHHTTNKND